MRTKFLELGSVVLDSEQSISIVQDPVFKEPFVAVYPLAAAVRYFVYQHSNFSKKVSSNPRLAISSLQYSTMMVLVLRGLEANQADSTIGGFLILFDPLYTASWASGRVDLWGRLFSCELSLLHPTYTIFTRPIGVFLALSVLSLAFFSHPASALLCHSIFKRT